MSIHRHFSLQQYMFKQLFSPLCLVLVSTSVLLPFFCKYLQGHTVNQISKWIQVKITILKIKHSWGMEEEFSSLIQFKDSKNAEYYYRQENKNVNIEEKKHTQNHKWSICVWWENIIMICCIEQSGNFFFFWDNVKDNAF